MKLKKALCSILALVLLMSCMSVTAFAESTEPWADGATPASNKIFYTATTKVVPDTTEYDSSLSTYDVNTGKGIMVFASDLTEIGENWFYGCESLDSVILPDSVTSIGRNAFYECVNLRSITMPKVTSIGTSAFGESNLHSIYMPEVTSIGTYAFENCENLEIIYMPKVTSIEEYAFYYCEGLKYVYAPPSFAAAMNNLNLYSVTLSATHGTIAVKDVDFEEVDGCATYIKEYEQVILLTTPDAGYKLDTLTYTPADEEAYIITDSGAFHMPTANVTVSATFEIATSGSINLDLEDDTDYPDSATIDQYYTKTEAGSTTYNHRIGVLWWTDAYSSLGHRNLVIEVNNAVKWDPLTLTWVEDDDLDGVASVKEGTDKVNFKLSNYSAKAFKCEITYAANTEDTKANKAANTVTFDSNNGATIAKVNNDINTIDETDEAYLTDGAVDLTKVPTLTITGTVGVDPEGFKDAEATASAVKYGKFTITCTVVDD